MSKWSGNPEFAVKEPEYPLTVKWICRKCGRLQDRPYLASDGEPMVDHNTWFGESPEENHTNPKWPYPMLYPIWECDYCEARRRFYL